MSLSREALIVSKQEVIAALQITRREFEREQAALRPDQRRLAALEARLQTLMAEEARLRQAIDRSRHRDE